MRGILVLFAVAVIAAGVMFAWPRLEDSAPVLSGPEQIELGAASRRIELGWEDEGSGLRDLEAYLELDSVPSETEEGAPKRIVLHSKHVAGTLLNGPFRPMESERIELDLDPGTLELPDGSVTLVLTARDWSWAELFKGNSAELRIPVVVDTQPPRVSVSSGLTYLRRGGAAAVVYHVDADALRSGARVGEAFFPGTPTDDGGQVAVFAVPIDAKPDPQVEIVAIDRAGNEATARFDARIQERVFPEITIALSDRFLDQVAIPLGENHGMSEATPLATFQRVNRELRARNEAVIADAIGEPTARQWTGAFQQMANSSVTSEFAELRHYTHRGQRVSLARHYGFDLASTARAPITASNSGTVIFAGDNGIYGTLVLIDHGLGITTLYGHLSSLSVKVGDRVEQGQELGRSGATGLAGGDHLHFAVLVGKTYVDPVEWWDPKWVREHIDSRLIATAEAVPQARR